MLKNVWTFDKNGEWVRTDAQRMDRVYEKSVSVESHQFRCYSCFQYVTFVKGDHRNSHFRHSSGYENKNCEDRSFSAGTGSAPACMSDLPMPLRLQIDGGRLIFSVGFLPLSAAELERCVAGGLQVRLSAGRGVPAVFRVDSSRFAPHMTNWLNLPAPMAGAPSVEFSPGKLRPSEWSGTLPAISDRGALFDAESGKHIPDKSDVRVGRPYWLLSKGIYTGDYRSMDIEMSPVATDNFPWRVYCVRAIRFSEGASNFFFSHQLRLTNHPVEMSVLWPPVLERDEVIETGFRRLLMAAKGEGDFRQYPRDSCTAKQIAEHGDLKLYELQDSGHLQMVTSERYSQALRFLYIRPMEQVLQSIEPEVEIVDGEGKPWNGEGMSSLPAQETLCFTPTDDGWVDVYEGEDFLYRKRLPAGENTRLTELRRNMCLRVRVGQERVREFLLAPKTLSKVNGEEAPLPLSRWSGRMVPFPRRYAWILERVSADSELQSRVKLALRQGKIPQEGLFALQRMMEGN